MIDDRLRTASQVLRHALDDGEPPSLPQLPGRRSLTAVVVGLAVIALCVVVATALSPAAHQSVSSQVPPPAVTLAPVDPTTSTAARRMTHLVRSLSELSSGDDVHRLQVRLAELGFAIADIDGQFGVTTRQAVWAYETLVLEEPLDHVTGVVTDEMWQTMQQPKTITPRRAGQGTHAEIYLAQQVLAVYRDDTPVFIAHVSSGTAPSRDGSGQWCETVVVDTDANGAAIDPPQEQPVCGIAYTPSGVFRFQRELAGHHIGDLGGMDNPVYFNYGIAVYGGQVVPLMPSTHGGVRIDDTLSAGFADVVHLGDLVYVWGDDGKEPEEVTKAESTPVFSYPAPPDTYTVDAGETVAAVAAELGTTVEDLVSLNSWTDGATHQFQIGERVLVPSPIRIAPLLTGLLESRANEVALDRGLSLSVSYQDLPAGSVNVGRVLAQTPPTNSPIPPGAAVQIVVGRALPPTTTS